MKKSIKVFLIFIGVLLLIGVIAVVCMVTDNFTRSEAKLFYVTYGSTEFTKGAENEMQLERGKSYIFTPTYTIAPAGGDYKVKIMATPDKSLSFEFLVENKSIEYVYCDDLTAGFDIAIGKKSIVLDIPNDFSMQTVLKKVYPNITTIPDVDLGKGYFTMQITSSNNIPVLVKLIF